MKRFLLTLAILISLSTSTLQASQRMTTIPSRTNYFNFDYSFCDLHLKSKTGNNFLSSHQVGLTHKVVGQNVSYMEHFGYVNWEDDYDEYGFYARVTVMYRNTVRNPLTSHDLFVGFGVTANFEFGVVDQEGFLLGEVGPILGVIYQIPDKGFSFYSFVVAEFILLSQVGDYNLEYSADPFLGLGFGLEYLIPSMNFNVGVETVFIRESSFVLYFGTRL